MRVRDGTLMVQESGLSAKHIANVILVNLIGATNIDGALRATG